MKLSAGIVGLPNVGKSTLFNALLQKQQAFAANFPFATVEPNIGIVPVRNQRLSQLAEIVETEKIVPATVKFVDIAGLVKGASQGEGLGNRFLAHIREVSLIIHVLRYFQDPNVVQAGTGNWLEDFKTVETELQLADLETLEKQSPPKGKVSPQEKEKWQLILKLKKVLAEGKSARNLNLKPDDLELISDLNLLTLKPVIFVVNLSETDLKQTSEIETKIAHQLQTKQPLLSLDAKLETELAELKNEERQEYLESLNLPSTGLDRLVQLAYKTLGLQSFLTAGKKEVKAWTIKKGTTAQEAAGVIHSDFAKNFINAKICNFNDFVSCNGWKGAAEAGKVRQEGREYIMQPNDIVEFMVNR